MPVKSWSARVLQGLRASHRVIGAFTAPALLFFALSGALQTFNLHETSKGSAYRPPTWIVAMSRVHKKQTLYAAPKKGTTAGAGAAAAAPPDPWGLKVFFALVALGLVISTLTGVYMSYRFARRKALVTVLLVLGVVTPLLLLWK